MRRTPSAKVSTEKALSDTRPLCEQNLSSVTNIHNDLIKGRSARHRDLFILTDSQHRLYAKNTAGYLVTKVIILLSLYAANADHILASEIKSLLNRIKIAAAPRNGTINLIALLEMIQETLNKIMDNSASLITANGGLAHLIFAIFSLYQGYDALTSSESLQPQFKEKIMRCFNELAERRLSILPDFPPISLKKLSHHGMIHLPNTRYGKYIAAACSAELSIDCAIRVLECYAARSRLARFWGVEFSVPTHRTHRETVEAWLEKLKNGQCSLESILSEFSKLPTTPDSDTEHAKTALYALLRVKEEETTQKIKNIFDHLIDKLPIPEKGTFSRQWVKNFLKEHPGYDEKLALLKAIIERAQAEFSKFTPEEEAKHRQIIQEIKQERTQAEDYIPLLLQNNPQGLAKHLEKATVQLGLSKEYQRLDSFYADHIVNTFSSGLKTDLLPFDEQNWEERETSMGSEEENGDSSLPSSPPSTDKLPNGSPSTLSTNVVIQASSRKTSNTTGILSTVSAFFSKRPSSDLPAQARATPCQKL